MESAAIALGQRLRSELAAGRRVLWLVSGGSNIGPSVSIMKSLSGELSRNLTVIPCDERYGQPGHVDSNWQQLLDGGFDGKQATLLPALKEGLDFNQNTSFYNDLMAKATSSADVIIVQLGMGSDGHVSGILPKTPACRETVESIVNYEAPPLRRMTSTFHNLRQASAIYLLAYGEGKADQLRRLKAEDVPLDEQPAQILKEISEAYVYNDQVED